LTLPTRRYKCRRESKTDKIVAQFKGDLTIPRLGDARARFRFLFDLSVDYPTKGSNRALHDFSDVAIAVQLGKMSAKSVVRYTNGEQDSSSIASCGSAFSEKSRGTGSDVVKASAPRAPSR
jgi:hypothetical protein